MCTICLRDKCPSGCPNYTPPKTIYCCSVCGEGIYEGEEYIVNDDGEYRHYDCFQGMRDLLEWLGYEVKTMDEVDEVDEEYY